jgi:hypothetical protein
VAAVNSLRRSEAGRQELGKGKQNESWVGAGVEEVVREEGGVFVGGNAAVFLEPLFFINAFGAETLEKGLAGFVAASFFIDALDDPFGDGFLDGDDVEGPAGAEGGDWSAGGMEGWSGGMRERGRDERGSGFGRELAFILARAPGRGKPVGFG